MTNEYDESIEITDLYAKVPLINNCLTAALFKLIRASYNSIQWRYGYLHSHVPKFRSLENATFWHSCCTGNGPINNTMRKLRDSSTSTLTNWLLFCVELDKYVHVESLTGGPHYRMSTIGNTNAITEISSLYTTTSYVGRILTQEFMNELIKYIIKSNQLTYSYINGCYSFGMSNENFIILVSNLFIEYVNQHVDELTSQQKEQILNIINRVIYRNGKLYHISTNNLESVSVENVCLFQFKGQPVYLTINRTSQEDNSTDMRILDTELVTMIAYKILKYINSNYEKSGNKVGATIWSL